MKRKLKFIFFQRSNVLKGWLDVFSKVRKMWSEQFGRTIVDLCFENEVGKKFAREYERSDMERGQLRWEIMFAAVAVSGVALRALYEKRLWSEIWRAMLSRLLYRIMEDNFLTQTSEAYEEGEPILILGKAIEQYLHCGDAGGSYTDVFIKRTIPDNVLLSQLAGFLEAAVAAASTISRKVNVQKETRNFVM